MKVYSPELTTRDAGTSGTSWMPLKRGIFTDFFKWTWFFKGFAHVNELRASWTKLRNAFLQVVNSMSSLLERAASQVQSFTSARPGWLRSRRLWRPTAAKMTINFSKSFLLHFSNSIQQFIATETYKEYNKKDQAETGPVGFPWSTDAVLFLLFWFEAITVVVVVVVVQWPSLAISEWICHEIMLLHLKRNNLLRLRRLRHLVQLELM